MAVPVVDSAVAREDPIPTPHRYKVEVKKLFYFAPSFILFFLGSGEMISDRKITLEF